MIRCYLALSLLLAPLAGCSAVFKLVYHQRLRPRSPAVAASQAAALGFAAADVFVATPKFWLGKQRDTLLLRPSQPAGTLTLPKVLVFDAAGRGVRVVRTDGCGPGAASVLDAALTQLNRLPDAAAARQNVHFTALDSLFTGLSGRPLTFASVHDSRPLYVALLTAPWVPKAVLRAQVEQLRLALGRHPLRSVRVLYLDCGFDQQTWDALQEGQRGVARQ